LTAILTLQICARAIGFQGCFLEILESQNNRMIANIESTTTAFDVKKINTWLRKLKWPRTTEGQLRKVLMARDDYPA